MNYLRICLWYLVFFYFRNKNVSFGGDKVFIFFYFNKCFFISYKFIFIFSAGDFLPMPTNYYQKYTQDKQKCDLLNISIGKF